MIPYVIQNCSGSIMWTPYSSGQNEAILLEFMIPYIIQNCSGCSIMCTPYSSGQNVAIEQG